jgi:hypothetical protein
MNMSFQIQNSVKMVVSAALAAVLTLIVITGISGAAGQQLAKTAALSAQSSSALVQNAG